MATLVLFPGRFVFAGLFYVSLHVFAMVWAVIVHAASPPHNGSPKNLLYALFFCACTVQESSMQECAGHHK